MSNALTIAMSDNESAWLYTLIAGAVVLLVVIVDGDAINRHVTSHSASPSQVYSTAASQK